MAQRKDSTNLTKLLWECLGAADPMLHMLEWLCDQLMEVDGTGGKKRRIHTVFHHREEA